MPDAPVIRLDEPGSFARDVFHRRHPVLIRQVLDALPYGPAERAALERLLAESTTGVLEPPGPGAPDRAEWLTWGQGLWGTRWESAPFLWAESWFYRRLLDATGFTGPGARQGVDPFGPLKAAELAGPAVDEELAALDRLPGLPEAQRRAALLSSALWGNRADLSFGLTAAPDGGRGGLLADDGALLWQWLERHPGGRVCLLADNAGRELLPDLVLADHLLAAGPAAAVDLFVKPQPWFVSDATAADVFAALARLREAPGEQAAAVGGRLWRAVGDGRLAVRTHPFLCAPLPFHDLPGDLRARLAGASLTIVKGDLNYRRLVGDRRWPPTTPFARAAGHFPSAVAALRTLKSEVVVGLDGARVAELDRGGEAWRTGGGYAVVQFRPQD
ncbi:damage-control phosphatase ARMT1 family protein [Kitasatospora sp. MBT63]|uniref:damage-control phosphatase ARMT1 family protein n=1 Tax=Kitasatospora sp. MBT63 TaxID=1444768 RepID=UPI000AD89FFD|nr:damage-control phosphatase ARMT1 family protein [Kitasatospora sp. MBT63]